MERRKWDVSYRERPGMPEKWAVIEAVTARGAAGIVARSLPGYGVTGCYKQMPEWSWRGTRYE